MTQITLSKPELAQKIDHTLLKPTLLLLDLEKLCSEASTYGFKTVCIPPAWVKTAKQLLNQSETEVITVVGFPLGYSLSESKAYEARLAIEQGASEIDMVINLSFLKNNKLTELENDIRIVKNECKSIPLKVILETAYLTDSEKVIAAKIAEAAGANFIKTSTGFATASGGFAPGVKENGATLADIELLRKNLNSKTQIKASGGIRDFDMAIKMIQAGANRLGTSAGVAILNGLKNESGY